MSQPAKQRWREAEGCRDGNRGGIEHGEKVTVVNGAGRTAQGATTSCHACVSVSAGRFPPFKAAVMFGFLQQCSYRK